MWIQNQWRGVWIVNDEQRPRNIIFEESTMISLGYSTLNEALGYIKGLIKRYGKDAKILEHCDSYSSSEQQHYYVHSPRPETDIEYSTRLKKEDEYKKDQEKRDLAEFKRLQQKFKT